MAKDQKPWDGVLKTIVTVLGVAFGSASLAFALSRASPAEIKAVENRISKVSERVVAVETILPGVLEVLRELKNMQKTQVLHEHD